MAPTPGKGNRWTQHSPGIRILGPMAPEPLCQGLSQPPMAEYAQADLGSTPSPVPWSTA